MLSRGYHFFSVSLYLNWLNNFFPFLSEWSNFNVSTRVIAGAHSSSFQGIEFSFEIPRVSLQNFEQEFDSCSSSLSHVEIKVVVIEVLIVCCLSGRKQEIQNMINPVINVFYLVLTGFQLPIN